MFSLARTASSYSPYARTERRGCRPRHLRRTDTGSHFELSSFKGKNVVLYFYPKADTPGCTKEACDFRDNAAKLTKGEHGDRRRLPDTSKAQAKFKEKFDLPFPLLADLDHKVAEDYGVWKEKSMYGKKYMGVERTTFVIDPSGKIKKIFPEGESGRPRRRSAGGNLAAHQAGPAKCRRYIIDACGLSSPSRSDD